MDTFYREQIIQQVATDKRNRDAGQADDVRSIPWVARVCRIADSDQPAVPIMSRSRYRDALCELWEMGRALDAGFQSHA